MACMAYPDPRVAQLMQITGVGLYTSFSILAIIGDTEWLPSASEHTAYVGLVPREQQSPRRAYHGHLTKAGDRLRLMVVAAQAAARWGAHWHEVHPGLRNDGGTAWRS